MTTLSLCIIVKNEEKALPSCLKSVQGKVDQIVLLDTGSTDNTVEIAQSYGAQVHHFTWCNDFAAARNTALQYVQTDWVLILDADEHLNPSALPKMQQAMADEQVLVINFLRQEVGATQSPYSLVSRLFRRHPQIKFSRPYHAIIDDSVTEILQQQNHWRILDLDEVAVLHYGYQPSVINSLDKYNRAQKAMESFFLNHPQDVYACSKLGALYLQTGNLTKAIKLLKQGLKSNLASPPILFELHYTLANAYSQQGKIQKSKNKFTDAAKHYEKAIAQPILPRLKLGAYNNLGSLLQIIGNLQAAEQLYEKCLTVDPYFATAYYNLGKIYKQQGRVSGAIAAYRQAIKLNPTDAYAYQNLGLILFKIGQISESVAALRQAINLHQQHNPQAVEALQNFLQDIGFAQAIDIKK